MIVTIDGPTASGKSSAARLLAEHMGAIYIYSGLLYRGVAYLLGTTWEYHADTIARADKKHIDWCVRALCYTYSPEHGACIYGNHESITPYMKSHYTDTLASSVSTNAYVRESINSLQQQLAEENHVVIDGRDAGTVVFPNADVKFYLTAAEYIRVLRWRHDQRKRGHLCSLLDSMRALRQRDRRDTLRATSPLKPAHDAYHVDNSQLTLTQTVQMLRMVIRHHQ